MIPPGFTKQQYIKLLDKATACADAWAEAQPVKYGYSYETTFQPKRGFLYETVKAVYLECLINQSDSFITTAKKAMKTHKKLLEKLND